MNSKDNLNNIARPTGKLSGTCHDALLYQRSLPPADRTNHLGFACFEALDALENAVNYFPEIAHDYDKILILLEYAKQSSLNEVQAIDIREAYNRSLDTAFPTSQEFLKWCHQFSGITQDHSLSSISLPRLRQLEVASLVDKGLKDLLKELCMALSRISCLDDSQGFRQAFEFYGEALVYSLLSKKFQTTRLEAKSTSMPDFSCRLKNGKEFFVELKTFDIVDGPYRPKQILAEAMQQQIEIERQVNEGRSVAVAIREVSPYKSAFGKPEEYDSASLVTVIDTLINKARSAFKPKQFAQGPTFAFALCDRLLLPGGKHSVAPHYCERGGLAIVSGVLWHVCFGQTGWPISRLPDFEGEPGIEGYMSQNGLLSDLEISFPSRALIFADTRWQEDLVLGLYDKNWSFNTSWNIEDTEQVLGELCCAFNDKDNSHGQLVAMT